MRIYLDNCCYNRPYDAQTQFKISMETRAKLYIQEQIRIKKYELADSFMLEFENSFNPNLISRAAIQEFREKYRTVFVPIERREQLQSQIDEIMLTGVKYKDAVHIACAVYANCIYFITTDTRLLKYKSSVIKLINPINFTQLEE